jgi:preprotein translocase SecE subunit
MNEKKANIFVRAYKAVTGFFSGVYAEVTRVVWPSREDLTTLTGVVLIAVITVGAFVAILTLIFEAIFSHLGV